MGFRIRTISPEQAEDARLAASWIAAAVIVGIAANCLVIARAMAGLSSF